MKRELPEGRKPITTMESADLVLRMHDKLAAGFTAGDRIARLEELYEAALDDAKAAEAYAEELEAKLTKAVEALDEAVYLLDPDEKGMVRQAGVYRIVTTLAELKGETDG
jgi:hypothetical protein